MIYPPPFFVAVVAEALSQTEARMQQSHPLRSIPIDLLAGVVARDLRLVFTRTGNDGDEDLIMTPEIPAMEIIADVLTTIAIRNQYLPPPRSDRWSLSETTPF